MASLAVAQKPGQTRTSNTLYCKNLPDKLQKDDLKQALYMLFSTYGSILDIVALKTAKMRGQAHVLFRDTQASTQALRALQGYEFFGKEMQLSFAATKSDTLAKLDGTYKQPESAANAALMTAAQQSIFAGPPGTSAASLPPTQPPPSLAPPPAAATTEAASPADAATPASQGVKRPRDESDDEQEAPEEKDEDAMDESDDE